MISLHRVVLAVAVSASLAACSQDAAGPLSTGVEAPSFLIAPDEGLKIHADYYDAAGNHVMVIEYGAGGYATTNPEAGYVASVVIKTVIPASGPVSGACITNTIERVETTPGWTYAIRKPGGCDKEIVVDIINPGTGEQAQFRFLMIYGKTKMDAGLIR